MMKCGGVITGDLAEQLIKAADDAKAERAAAMPTEQEALQVMFAGWLRLYELGWREAMYCPKDGTIFDSISAGSTGIHECYYDGEWPNGSWWTLDGGDVWPGAPILWKAKP